MLIITKSVLNNLTCILRFLERLVTLYGEVWNLVLTCDILIKSFISHEKNFINFYDVMCMQYKLCTVSS